MIDFLTEILEICGQIDSKKCEHNLPSRIKTLNTEKQVPPKQIETQNTENLNATNSRATKQMLTQEDKINVELIRKIIPEMKTTLPSLRNQDCEKVKVET